MREAPISQTLIRFGAFELDPESRELRKQGVRVRLQEQPFQLLQVLLERPGRVVPREELQQRIWPSDTFVDFDSGLYNAIKRLREALGDSADSPRFIETLSRRGYRFIAGVEGNGQAAAIQVPALQGPKLLPRRSKRLAITLGLAAAIVGVALGVARFWHRFSGASTVPQIRSIAVLPLQNLSGDPNQEYFSDGMTDALITDLAQIGALKVVSRTTTLHYKDTRKPLPQIARELNVDGIVEGAVQRSGDRVRITAQLIYGPADQHLWAKSFDRDVKDMLALQSIVASEIADEIQVKITPVERARLRKVRPVNPKALDAYVAARFHFDQARELEDQKDKKPVLREEVAKAVSYLDQAVQVDPGYIPAYLSYFNDAVDAIDMPRLEYLPKAKMALEKALEVDDESVDAHLALAALLMQYEYDWLDAEKEYVKAIQLNPNSADAHYQYSDYLAFVERKAEAKKELDLAQGLNPAHDYFATSGIPTSGQDLEQERRVLDEQASNNAFHVAVMAKDYAIAGRYEESVEMWERCNAVLGWQDFASLLKQSDAKGGAKFALEEWMRAAEEYAKKHDDWSVVPMTFTYASLGNKDRAFAWLDKAVEQRHWLVLYLKVDNVWYPLRSDARFNALLRRVGLPI